MNDQIPPDTKGIEVVRFDDIISQSNIKSGKELSTTRIGYRLAILLLIYLALVTGFLIIDFFLHNPSIPKPTEFSNENLHVYKELSKVATDRTLRLFDQFIQKSFLPVFTAILGYIFGTRGTK